MALLLFIWAAFPQDEFRHPYSNCAEGSWVRHRTTLEVAGQTSVSTQTSTVARIERDQVVIRTTVDMAGMTSREQEDVLATKGLPGSSEVRGHKVKTEEIVVEGRAYACDVWEFETSSDTYRVWLTRAVKVPGGSLRTEARIKQGDRDVTTVSRVVALREKVRVGKRELDCTVSEYSSQSGGLHVQGRLWNSSQVPGFMVRSELRMNSARTRTELVAFEIKE